MLTVIRKNQRVLLLIVAVLTIIAFAFLYNITDFQNIGANDLAKLYGRTVTVAEADRYGRLYQIALVLGQVQLVQDLGGRGAGQEQAVTEFIWNMIILDHETEALGIRATDEEVVARIKEVPLFQTNGAYDPTKYSRFIAEQLGPRGFTERDLEALVRDTLNLDRLKQVIGSVVSLSPTEMNSAMDAFRPVTFEVAELSRDSAVAQAQVTAEEIRQFYEDHKAHFLTEETRSVRYVVFAPTEEELSLEGKERVAALQKQADAAAAFQEKVLEGAGSFEEVARESEVAVETSPDFTVEGTIADPVGISLETMQQLSANVRAFARPAFGLSEEQPLSEILQSGDRFYVLELDHVTPERPMTLAEATPRITQELRQRAADKIFAADSGRVEAELRRAVVSGQSFREAAEALGLQVRSFDGISPMDPSVSPAEAPYAIATLSLEPGEISPLQPTPTGGAVVYLASRADEPTAPPEAETEMSARILRNKQDLLFYEWLRDAREASDLTLLRSR